MKVRILAPMYFGGVLAKVGSIVDIADHVEALGAIFRGRAEKVREETPAPSPAPAEEKKPAPMTTESAPELVGKKRKQKEQSNASG